MQPEKILPWRRGFLVRLFESLDRRMFSGQISALRVFKVFRLVIIYMLFLTFVSTYNWLRTFPSGAIYICWHFILQDGGIQLPASEDVDIFFSGARFMLKLSKYSQKWTLKIRISPKCAYSAWRSSSSS